MITRRYLHLLTGVLVLAAAGAVRAAENPFLGGWELTIPGGAAGWLGVEESHGHLRASMLWGWGSVEPLPSATFENGQLVVTRNHSVERTGPDGKKTRQLLKETITATLDGDTIKLTSVKPKDNGEGTDTATFAGRRTPPMPPAPDLSQVKYGDPIELFNGKDLAGWRPVTTDVPNGWSAKGGLLVNEAPQEPGKHKSYANLRTEREFEDFNLKLETRLPKDGNSGVYVRGMYEVQVADTYGHRVDPHNMGAVYSRITPLVAAEKPAGEWQTMDITFVNRHITVILNGTKIIDNQPVAGCTGGALWSDVSRPGPIYLQGDHTSVEYRNLVLRPVVK